MGSFRITAFELERARMRFTPTLNVAHLHNNGQANDRNGGQHDRSGEESPEKSGRHD